MTDPFDTLGVEPRFDIDLRAVEQRHRDLSRALHPDRYAAAPAAERRLALGRAIEVNEAFRTLRDPVRRAEALLARAGIDMREDAAPKASPAFLMDIMEAREALAEVARKRDRARLTALADAMRAREAATLSAIGAALDGAGGDPHKAREALPLLGELRYVRRYLDEASAIDEDIADTP